MNHRADIRRKFFRTAVFLLVYILHTCSTQLLTASPYVNSIKDAKARHTEKKAHDKKKPYSLFIVKHVPLKQKAAEDKVAFVAQPTLLQVKPEVKLAGFYNSNEFRYRLPDDSYKRYRLMRTLLI